MMVDVRTLKAVGGTIYREVSGRKMRKPEVIKSLLNRKNIQKVFAITVENKDEGSDYKTNTYICDVCHYTNGSFHFTPYDGDMDVLIELESILYVIEVEVLS